MLRQLTFPHCSHLPACATILSHSESVTWMSASKQIFLNKSDLSFSTLKNYSASYISLLASHSRTEGLNVGLAQPAEMIML